MELNDLLRDCVYKPTVVHARSGSMQRHGRKSALREELRGALVVGLAQLGGVNRGQPDLDLLFSDEDGQRAAVVDGYD
jgi:hypothetical protein